MNAIVIIMVGPAPSRVHKKYFFSLFIRVNGHPWCAALDEIVIIRRNNLYNTVQAYQLSWAPHLLRIKRNDTTVTDRIRLYLKLKYMDQTTEYCRGKRNREPT